MQEFVKSGWCSAQDIVNDQGITIYELFDYIKIGLQAYTITHDEVVDSDYLLDIKRKLLIYFTAKVKKEHQGYYLLDDDKMYALADHEYNIRFRDIFDYPQRTAYISFSELLKKSLAEVWTFQFKTSDVDKFFSSALNQYDALPSHDKFLQEKEQQAWKVVSEKMDVSPEEIKMVAADFIRDDLQDIFTNNRAAINGKTEGAIPKPLENSILSGFYEGGKPLSELTDLLDKMKAESARHLGEISKSPDKDDSDFEQFLREDQSKKGQKGGSASKINKPILQATIQFIKEQPVRMKESAEKICDDFKRKNRSEDNAINIIIDNVENDVYYDSKKIYCKSFFNNKTLEESISLNTFRNNYISKAKKEIISQNK